MIRPIFSKQDDLGLLGSREFYNIIKDIMNNETVHELAFYRHHYGTDRLQHCINVSYYSCLWCKKFRLDHVSAARAGLMHDMYFYDTKQFKKTQGKLYHNKTHPVQALNNAKIFFELNAKETDCILSHMWPITLKLPKYKESYLVSLADKYVSVLEYSSYLIGAVYHSIKKAAFQVQR